MKRIAILGSTGSIGQSALAVVDAFPDRLQVVGLAAGAVAVIDATDLGSPVESLRDIPAGDYYVEAAVSVYSEFKDSKDFEKFISKIGKKKK